jgi:hypothetical protein
MKRALLVPTCLSLFVLVGCGSSDSPGGDGSAAPGDGSVPGADTSVSNADGSTTADTAMTGTDGGTAMDQAAGTDAAATTSDPIPVMGDHYCMSGPQPSEDVQYVLGVDTACTITKAPMPLTAMQKMTYDYLCTFYGGAVKVVDSCPRDNVVAYCVGQGVAPGTKGWKLIYKSKVTPDTEAVALNALGLCPGGKLYDAGGMPIAVRTCKGTFTAKVNGVDKSFTEHRVCALRSIGTKAEYAIIGDTTTGDRLSLLVGRDNGVFKIGNAVYPSAAYLEGGTKPFAAGNPATQMITVTKSEDKGGVLTATFTIGDLKNASESRTITEGVLDLSISP